MKFFKSRWEKDFDQKLEAWDRSYMKQAQAYRDEMIRLNPWLEGTFDDNPVTSMLDPNHCHKIKL